MLTEDAGYNGAIIIEHGKSDCKMESKYVHVILREGLKAYTKVKKGNIIGTLYIDEPDENNSGRLVHLHLELLNGKETIAKAMLSRKEEVLVSPLDILDPSMRDLTATPQQSNNFRVPGLERSPIKIANFQKVLVDERRPKK